MAPEAQEGKGLLFSEEKRSKKDFPHLPPRPIYWHARKRIKVFWFFFSKKNPFLAFPCFLRHHAIPPRRTQA
jgi:hypothetical protein